MLAKPIETLSADDIKALVANGVPEGRSLDYKEQLPGRSDQDRAEFLADICSFANSLGGRIVFGVSELRDESGKQTGMASEVLGFEGNLEPEILRLESMCRDGIDPRIPSIRLVPVPGGTFGDVLVCSIPKSWVAPHMVTFRGTSRFFSRGASGKYQMDVRQIRDAFVGGEGLREAIRRFRFDRVAKVASGEASPTGRFLATAQAVLHVVPISAFESGGSAQDAVDLDAIRTREFEGQPHQHRRYNFDGVLGWTNSHEGHCIDYLQVFRNGAVEADDALTLRREDKTFPSTTFEQRVLHAAAQHLSGLVSWGVSGPFVVMLSLVNVMGYRMAVRFNLFPEEDFPIDRDMLVLPELWIEEPVASNAIPQLMRRMLDVVWQSAGIGGNPNAER